MKQNQRESSTLPQIFESPHQEAIYDMFEEWSDEDFLLDDGLWNPGPLLTNADLIKPNPPTPEAVKKAQFVDKTYHWLGHH